MRFDVFKWSEIDVNKSFPHDAGLLHIMCDRDAVVWVEAEGFEVIAGSGKEIRVTLAQAVRVKVVAHKDARAFLYDLPMNAQIGDQQTFANADRLTMESGAVREVKKALRQMRLEHAQQMAELRAAERRAGRLPVETQDPAEQPEGDQPEGETQDPAEQPEGVAE